MGWFWTLITGPVLETIVGALPNLLGEQLRTRGVIRQQRDQARLSELADERRNAAQLAYLEQEHQRRILMEKYTNQAERYPLGVIGRLRDLTAINDARPAVVVSPTAGAASGVPPLVQQALQDISEFAAFAQLHTGGFVSDAGISRVIAGSVGAAEIGALEFPGHPAILIYFEDSGRQINVFAYLGSMFPLSDGRTGFDLRIGSFGAGGRPSAASNGSLPTWQYIDLNEIDGPQEEAIAAVVAWFVATCVETYWELRGVRSLDLRVPRQAPIAAADRSPLPEAPEPEISLIDRLNDSASVFGCRIQQEATTLLQLGYLDIETFEFGTERVELHVSSAARSTSFLLDSEFPASPPEIFSINATGCERILLDASAWSPEHTLADILEALQ